MTMRRLVLLLGLLLVPLMWLGAEPALACSCVPSTTADQVERADAVVLGRLTEQARAGTELVYTFFGEERFKGGSVPGFEVRTSESGASCGVTGLVVGRRYVVFMDEEGDRLLANSCGGTRPASPRFVQDVEEITGRGTSFDLPPPEPEVDPAAVVARLVASLAWWD